MLNPKKDLPEDTVLVGTSRAVFKVLARHTMFPWAILKTQCKLLAIDPCTLHRTQLDTLIERLVPAVARFTSPLVGKQAEKELRQI